MLTSLIFIWIIRKDYSLFSKKKKKKIPRYIFHTLKYNKACQKNNVNNTTFYIFLFTLFAKWIEPKWVKPIGIQLEVRKTLAIKQVPAQVIDLYLDILIEIKVMSNEYS